MNFKRAEFGKWLQQKRDKSGFSQSDIAKKLSIAKSFVAQWETGVAPVPIEKLFDLAELYELDMQDIIDQLNYCEPQIAARFNALSHRFAKYHLDLMISKKSSGMLGGSVNRAHHVPFPSALGTEAIGSDNNRIVNYTDRFLYIM